MTTVLCNIQPEVLEIIEEGTCEECYKIGKMYEAIVFTSDLMPGEVRCLCTKCISEFL
jgi:hypothetical protein